jgi:hypothetical protein
MTGKILQDATTVGQHNIKEKDFLVVMVTKVSPCTLLDGWNCWESAAKVGSAVGMNIF